MATSLSVPQIPKKKHIERENSWIHGLKMSNPIDHTEKNITRMEPNFISPKNIAGVGKNKQN